MSIWPPLSSHLTPACEPDQALCTAAASVGQDNGMGHTEGLWLFAWLTDSTRLAAQHGQAEPGPEQQPPPQSARSPHLQAEHGGGDGGEGARPLNAEASRGAAAGQSPGHTPPATSLAHGHMANSSGRAWQKALHCSPHSTAPLTAASGPWTPPARGAAEGWRWRSSFSPPRNYSYSICNRLGRCLHRSLSNWKKIKREFRKKNVFSGCLLSLRNSSSLRVISN